MDLVVQFYLLCRFQCGIPVPLRRREDSQKALLVALARSRRASVSYQSVSFDHSGYHTPLELKPSSPEVMCEPAAGTKVVIMGTPLGPKWLEPK